MAGQVLHQHRLDWMKRLSHIFVAAYCLISIGAWLLKHFLGDGNAAGMLLVFGPRWWLLLPAPIALITAWRISKRVLVGVLLSTALLLFGVNDFELPRLHGQAMGSSGFRLVTYNSDRSAELAARIRRDLNLWQADVVLLQGCKTVVADTLRALRQGHVHVTPEFCLYSRWPIIRVTLPLPGQASVADQTQKGRYTGSRHTIRYDLAAPWGRLPIYSLHLESPRRALLAARRLDFSMLDESIRLRSAASLRASLAIDATDSAFVVAGDFNLPSGSLILRQHWGELDNAFVRAGSGFGWTMFAGHHSVRIDHVLTPATLSARRVTVLRGFPSEHQPVVVDLSWR